MELPTCYGCSMWPIVVCIFLSVIWITPAFAQVDACVQRKIAAVEQRQPISNRGGVTCGSADVVGFPPRERKHDASGQICLTAPEGRALVNERVTSITVDVLSNNGGEHGNVIAKDEKQACVHISCRGAGLGQGRRWIEISLRGETKASISQPALIEMAVSCAQNPSQ